MYNDNTYMIIFSENYDETIDVEYDKWFYRNTYKQHKGMDVRMKILVKVKYMQTICL